MKQPKLYQTLTEKQMDNFLKANGTALADQKPVEIKDEASDLYGDFIVIDGYKFKKIYSEYQCLETPKEKHAKQRVSIRQAPNDNYKNWKSKAK